MEIDCIETSPEGFLDRIVEIPEAQAFVDTFREFTKFVDPETYGLYLGSGVYGLIADADNPSAPGSLGLETNIESSNYVRLSIYLRRAKQVIQDRKRFFEEYNTLFTDTLNASSGVDKRGRVNYKNKYIFIEVEGNPSLLVWETKVQAFHIGNRFSKGGV